MEHKWLEWATRLQSIAQAGLTFSTNSYDLDRYKQIRELSFEIMHEHTGVSTEKIASVFECETGYQTPKVDIRSAVFKEGKILLVREKLDGAWAMPGGWADVNTSPAESAVRECLEEAGAVVRPRRVVAVHLASRQNSHVGPYTIYKIFFECELVRFNFTENTETLDAAFFPPDALPPLSTERTMEEQVKLCFNASKHELFEPEFD
ncbi:MAG: NUDIX hydrolase N-terminal domain-containing protein [Bacteroidales bacterium]